MKKQFAVIGIGRFGYSLATKLYQLGFDVIAIDNNEKIVQKIADLVTYSVQADASDIDVLKTIGLKNVDCVIISIGSDLNASLMATLNAKELEISEVFAKAPNEQHAKVLYKIGADKVFLPERDMGRRLAHNIVSTNILDMIELDPDHSVIEINAFSGWHDKDLRRLDLRAKYGINVIAIKRGTEIIISPKPTEQILTKDVMVVIGNNKSLAAIQKAEG
ncbi:TrkA family potassium uptake protein [Alkalibaculum sp. M08DMB]|uniref:TrkA family potassium uptake protein n=1 Tax=Alkalibaculum sporogenes TaxID=2655001 RepID=A0A6A7K6J8_9FIRM|nr:TrkA family potassium uptake protein [Alkalibaculum sporogenes]MPW25109.1 TrkA family potassium uptake protein [Alkalibaculum sporogenes]